MGHFKEGFEIGGVGQILLRRWRSNIEGGFIPRDFQPSSWQLIKSERFYAVGLFRSNSELKTPHKF